LGCYGKYCRFQEQLKTVSDICQRKLLEGLLVLEQEKPADEMQLSSKEFDRIMGQVLQAKLKSKKVTKGNPTKAKRNGKGRNFI
jgi:hypothetical protein